MVKLFFASQGSTGCLSLELLTARLDKAHENMPRGTMLHMISQHSWELQTEGDWWSQSPPSHHPSVRLGAAEGCLTQWDNQHGAHIGTHWFSHTESQNTDFFKALLQELDTKDLHALVNGSEAADSTSFRRCLSGWTSGRGPMCWKESSPHGAGGGNGKAGRFSKGLPLGTDCSEILVLALHAVPRSALGEITPGSRTWQWANWAYPCCKLSFLLEPQSLDWASWGAAWAQDSSCNRTRRTPSQKQVQLVLTWIQNDHCSNKVMG